MIYELKYGGYEYQNLFDYYNSERNSAGLESVNIDEFTSRLASVNNAANMSGYKTFNNSKDLIQEAEKLYKYIKG